MLWCCLGLFCLNLPHHTVYPLFKTSTRNQFFFTNSHFDFLITQAQSQFVYACMIQVQNLAHNGPNFSKIEIFSEENYNIKGPLFITDFFYFTPSITFWFETKGIEISLCVFQATFVMIANSQQPFSTNKMADITTGAAMVCLRPRILTPRRSWVERQLVLPKIYFRYRTPHFFLTFTQARP